MRIWLPLSQQAGALDASTDASTDASASSTIASDADGNDAIPGDPAADRVPRPRRIP
jgi:hypothetical protein